MKSPIDCFLVLDRASAVRSFLYKENGGSTECLNLTVINAVENLAQRVFVSRGFDEGGSYPSLDGDGIGKDSDKHVHLVAVGMTQVSYAMATTAAHICHFPNFSRGIRTKITFVMPDIRREMDFFRGRYSHLREISYSRYVSVDEYGNERVEEPDLIIPHAGLTERAFVLVPMLEVFFQNADLSINKSFYSECLESLSHQEIVKVH
jgi:hypothetical protein